MKRIQLWSVADTAEGQVQAIGLDELASTETEQRLEDLLVASPELLLGGLSLIGRQLPVEGGTLDLLGVDQDGRLVLLELKRGTLTREAVAQILDYVSDLKARDPDQLARVIEEHSDRQGIEKIEDFLDWYSREFPDATGPLEQTPRMLLVGLGVDPRARRIVDYLADAGIDIRLWTFHAFRSGQGLFLARQVETIDPARPISATGGPTKEENLRTLLALAEQKGVKDLLITVGVFIRSRGPFYQWPGKTAFSFSLPLRTKEGRPTNRSYVTLWVPHKKRGTLLLSLAPRALEVVLGAAEEFIGKVSSAKKVDSSWAPLQVIIDARSWPSIQEHLGDLLDALMAGRHRAWSGAENGTTTERQDDSPHRATEEDAKGSP